MGPRCGVRPSSQPMKSVPCDVFSSDELVQIPQIGFTDAKVMSNIA